MTQSEVWTLAITTKTRRYSMCSGSGFLDTTPSERTFRPFRRILNPDQEVCTCVKTLLWAGSAKYPWPRETPLPLHLGSCNKKAILPGWLIRYNVTLGIMATKRAEMVYLYWKLCSLQELAYVKSTVKRENETASVLVTRYFAFASCVSPCFHSRMDVPSGTSQRGSSLDYQGASPNFETFFNAAPR